MEASNQETSGAHTREICEECETLVSVVICETCAMELCEMCFDVLHRKGKRARHKKKVKDGNKGGGVVENDSGGSSPVSPSSNGM